MKVVILCGGYGTRIRDIADDIPKPMIPIGDKPILWHIMKYYATWGYTDFVLCLGYKGSVIKDFFLNYQVHTRDFTLTLGEQKAITYHNEIEEMNWNVTMVETGKDAMTGARVKRVEKYIQDEKFFLTYGDGLGNVDLKELENFHKKHDRILTVTGVHPPGRFGELMFDENGEVTEFNEKPQTTEGRISGGFFVCDRRIFKYLDDRDDLVFEVEPMKQLVQQKQMMVYEHNGFWQPMDTSREFKLLNEMVKNENAPWMIWK